MDNLTDILINTITILRQKKTQNAIGGTTYDPTNSTTIHLNEPCSIQSASPGDILEFDRRNIKVSHKIYMQSNNGVKLGDIAQDNRFSTPRIYTISWIEDMAGFGQIYGIFCNLIK